MKYNCRTCYWNEYYNQNTSDFPAKCSSCSYDSSPTNPYPKWTPMDNLTSFKTLADFTDILQSRVEIEETPEDIVNHPKHYTGHPSGIECIQVTEYMGFCLGNAIKYIWRANDKHDSPLEDLRKAKWYIEREIARLEKNEA
jgi:hypothetical protein